MHLRNSIPMMCAVILIGCVGEVPKPVVPEVVYPPQDELGVAANTAISNVTVSVGAIPAENAERLEMHGARQRIQNELMQQLAADGRFGSMGETELALSINSFRLRTQKAAHLYGAMAGADTLAVAVTVSRDNQTIKEFETGTSTALAKPKREADRLDKMVAELARRVIEQL